MYRTSREWYSKEGMQDMGEGSHKHPLTPPEKENILLDLCEQGCVKNPSAASRNF